MPVRCEGCQREFPKILTSSHLKVCLKLTPAEYKVLHGERSTVSPEYAEELQQKCRVAQNRPDLKERLRAERLSRWANPEYKERLRAKAKEVWANDPSRQEKMLAARTPEVEERRIAAITENARSEEFRQKMSVIAQAKVADPEWHQKLSEAQKRVWRGNEDLRRRRIESITAAASTPEYKAKIAEANRRAWARDPARHEHSSQVMKAMNADPAHQVKIAAGLARSQRMSGFHRRVIAALQAAGLYEGWKSEQWVHDGVLVDEAHWGRRIALEANGCYWHGFEHPAEACGVLRANGTWETRKWELDLRVVQNHENWQRKVAALRAGGWRLVVVWEHETDLAIAERVREALDFFQIILPNQRVSTI